MKTTSNNKTRKPCTSVRYLRQHRRSKWEAIQKKFTPVREAFKVKICDNVRGYLITTYRYCRDGYWITYILQWPDYEEYAERKQFEYYGEWNWVSTNIVQNNRNSTEDSTSKTRYGIRGLTQTQIAL